MNRFVTVTLFMVLVLNTAWGQLLRYSSDTWTLLDNNPVDHGEVVFDPQTGTVSVSDPLELPAAVDLAGLETGSDGAWLFSVDSSVLLDGVLVSRSDVGQLSGGVYSVAFDGSSEGVSSGAGVDAVTIDGDDLLLSFDVTIDFGTFVAHDEDLVRYDGADLSLELDLSAEGLPENLDLEAVHRLDDGTYLLSLTTHGEVSGVSFADEDILGLDPSDSGWSMAFDGSTMHADLGDVSIDALSTAGELIFEDGFETVVMLFR